MTLVPACLGVVVALQMCERLALQIRLNDFDPWASGEIQDWLYRAVLMLSLLAAAVGVFHPNLASTILMCVGVYTTAIRHRGTFNGGSDTITIHLLMAVAAMQFVPDWSAEVRLYILVFVTLSYFVAGGAKISSSDWRSGAALTRILLFSNAAIPNRVTEWVRRNPDKTRSWAWAIMLWELLFPIVFFFPSLTAPFLAAGVIFHVLNFYFFGLNRFFWAWIAAYPAFFSA